jgi:hypothetical protein
MLGADVFVPEAIGFLSGVFQAQTNAIGHSVEHTFFLGTA